ncbi:hypothetical protein DU490_06640 [Halomonas sp. DQ26W]|uniref:hypothetical protein n=1 Tax=Halomonas sp. DQ26W TaxID=2282311 RepID=UPI000DF7FAE6|nr:hypothetical protein [Halomonas sp. DQ26W]RDB43625.1 hypothetical protein DU490_06640 [Halomonas sp. DQ26W]
MSMEDREESWREGDRREGRPPPGWLRRGRGSAGEEFADEADFPPRAHQGRSRSVEKAGRRGFHVVSFLIGSAVTFALLMVVLNLSPEALFVPFEATRRALETLGVM